MCGLRGILTGGIEVAPPLVGAESVLDLHHQTRAQLDTHGDHVLHATKHVRRYNATLLGHSKL